MKKKSHPYIAFEEKAIWQALDKALRALVKNGDLNEQTAHEYVVGYLAKSLTEAGFDQVSVLKTAGKIIHVVQVHEQQPFSVYKKVGVSAR